MAYVSYSSVVSCLRAGPVSCLRLRRLRQYLSDFGVFSSPALSLAVLSMSSCSHILLTPFNMSFVAVLYVCSPVSMHFDVSLIVFEVLYSVSGTNTFMFTGQPPKHKGKQKSRNNESEKPRFVSSQILQGFNGDHIGFTVTIWVESACW